MSKQDRCPCGGIILADTDECTTMLCIQCAEQIAKVMLERDQNYNEGFVAGQQSVLARMPSEEEFNNAMLESCNLQCMRTSELIFTGFKKGVNWLRTKLLSEGRE